MRSKPKSQTQDQGFGSCPFFIVYLGIVYIVDLSIFLASEEACQLHKKVGFYAISSFTKEPDCLKRKSRDYTNAHDFFCNNKDEFNCVTTPS